MLPTTVAKPPVVGDPAPDFALPDQDGRTVRLANYRGKSPVVVFFYPMDGSPSCTREACSFRDSHQAFADSGAVVLGISADTGASHARFAASHKLPYRLLTDKGGAVRKQYGATILTLFPGRVTFVIDQDGIVRHRYDSSHSGRHVAEALATLKSLTS